MLKFCYCLLTSAIITSSTIRNDEVERPLAFPRVAKQQGNKCESQKKDDFRCS
jgi:hypothetical protein